MRDRGLFTFHGWQAFFLQLSVLLASLFAGALFTLRLAPLAVGIAWAIFFSVNSTKQSLNAKAQTVFLFAFGLLAGGAWWIFLGIRDPQNNSLLSALALVGFVLILHSLIHTIVFVLIHSLLRAVPRFFGKTSSTIFSSAELALVISWPLAELVRSVWFWAFPWMFIGYSQIDNPLLLGIFPIAGVYGVTCAAIVWYWIAYRFTAQIYASLKSRTALLANQRSALSALLLGLASTAFASTKHIEWTHPLADQRLSIKIFHTNLPNSTKYLPENQTLALQTLIEEATAEDTDLAVFPEFFIPKPVENLSETYLAELLSALNRNNQTLLFGIPVITQFPNSSPGNYNAVVQLNRQQEPATYAKEILVPFTEYMPWNPLIRWAYPFIFKYPLAENISGRGANQQLQLPSGIRLGASICYEIAFSYHGANRAHAANVLVNLSSDSWIPSGAYFAQTHQMARARAAEAQKPLLRSNNVGVSAVIGAHGEELNLRFSEEGALVHLVTPRQGATPFSNAMKFLADVFGTSLHP